MRRTEPALLLVLAAAWGAVYPLTTVALRHVSPEGVVFWRTAAAAAVLAPAAVRPWMLATVKKRWRAVLVATGLQATVPLVLLTLGQQHVSASVAGVISGAQPAAVALLALAIPGAHRPGFRELAGIATGAAGVVLLFARGLDSGHTQLAGGLIVLGSAICFALGAVWIDARLTDVPPLATAATAMCVSAVALLPFAIIEGGAHVSLPVAADLAALGAVGTGAALVLFYTLIRQVGAARAGLGFLLAPAFAVLYGVALLHDRLTSEIVTGLVLITVGSLLTLDAGQGVTS